MFKIHSRSHQGFTLIELVVSIACSSIVLLSMYQMFHSQQRTYTSHDESYNMKQNLRAGIYLLAREIRAAGFNPTRTDNVEIGFVTNFPPVNIFQDINGNDINYLTDRDRIAFSIDKNSDKCIDADNLNAPANCDNLTRDPNAPNLDGQRGEQIAYRLFDSKIQRYNSEIFFETGDVGQAWQTIATNVDALNFVFLDSNGNIINNPFSLNAPTARSVEISILVKSANKDHNKADYKMYTNKQGENLCPQCTVDHHRRRQISTTVRLRNLQ